MKKHELFCQHGIDLDIPSCIVDIACSYFERLMVIIGSKVCQHQMYSYVCLSLACKLYADQDTLYDMLGHVSPLMRTTLQEDLATREIEVAEALNWNLLYVQPHLLCDET